MAGPKSGLDGLSVDDRRMVESLLVGFDLDWRDGLLAERVRRLPPPGSPARLPALVEMVKIDLERRWQQGERVGLDAYLKAYPELGTHETASPELIRAEYEVRRQFGDGVTL